MSLDNNPKDEIWTFESSKKLVERVDRVVWFFAWPIWAILEWTKKRVDILSGKNPTIKKKNSILSSIMNNWIPKEEFAKDLVDLLEKEVITGSDIKSAITIYLNTRSIALLSYLSASDVFPWKKWKKVTIPKLANDLDEEDKFILAYWLKNKIISWSMSQYITFSVEEWKVLFIERYWSINMVNEYFKKFMFEIETLCTK